MTDDKDVFNRPIKSPYDTIVGLLAVPVLIAILIASASYRKTDIEVSGVIVSEKEICAANNCMQEVSLSIRGECCLKVTTSIKPKLNPGEKVILQAYQKGLCRRDCTGYSIQKRAGAGS